MGTMMSRERTELQLHDHGYGDPPTVLLHGVFMDHTLWDPVVPHLAGRVVRLDMPGHGASEPMAAGASLDDHVQAVASALDAAHLRGAVIVGHSWGGMVGIRLARARPDLVGGLVLTNTPLRRTRGLARIGFWSQRLVLAFGFPLGLYGRVAARSLIGPSHRAADPGSEAAMGDRMRRLGRRQVDETLRSVLLEPEDGLDLLAGIEVPWLAVAGRDDYVIGDGMADRVAALGELHIVDGAHSTPLEDPTAIVDAVATVRAALAEPS